MRNRYINNYMVVHKYGEANNFEAISIKFQFDMHYFWENMKDGKMGGQLSL